jgi:hypothetical protein
MQRANEPTDCEGSMTLHDGNAQFWEHRFSNMLSTKHNFTILKFIAHVQLKCKKLLSFKSSTFGNGTTFMLAAARFTRSTV